MSVPLTPILFFLSANGFQCHFEITSEINLTSEGKIRFLIIFPLPSLAQGSEDRLERLPIRSGPRPVVWNGVREDEPSLFRSHGFSQPSLRQRRSTLTDVRCRRPRDLRIPRVYEGDGDGKG